MALSTVQYQASYIAPFQAVFIQPSELIMAAQLDHGDRNCMSICMTSLLVFATLFTIN